MPAPPPVRATPALVASLAGALLVGALLTLSACDGEAPAERPEVTGASLDAALAGQRAQVARAIDGDTIDVITRTGERQRVRLLGIDAPESTTLRTGRAECGGQEASAAMRTLVPRGSQVILTPDASQDAEDRYGRLLAYVTPASGGPTLQEQLLEAGWAQVYEQRGEPIQRDAAFRAAALTARRAGAGVWQRCDGNFRQPQ